MKKPDPGLMKKRFTDDDIIRFLYDEMNPAECEAFLASLYTDESLWERYEALQETVGSLTGLQYEPSEQSLDKIRAVAKEEAATPLPAPPAAKRKPLWAYIPKDLPLKAVASLAFLLFMTVAITGSFYTLGQRSQLADNSRPQPNSQIFHQVDNDYDPMFQWDDSDLDRQLDELRDRVEEIEKTL